MKKGTLISVVGPTAIGKTSTAIKLAKEFNGEIISADSRQFYQELSIGTAKPSVEEMQNIPHHFVNNLSVIEGQTFSASAFETAVISFLDQYFNDRKVAFLVGGSGLYVDAICKGFDENMPGHDVEVRVELQQKLELEGIDALKDQLKTLDPLFYQTVDLNNSKRVLRALEVCLITGKPYSTLRKGQVRDRSFNIVKIGLEVERTKLYNRINERVDQMIEAGLEQEVKSLLKYQGFNALQTVGYQEFFNYFNGLCTYDEAVEKIKTNTRRYAKRQLTWFKKDDEITWFNPKNVEALINHLKTSIS